MKKLTGILCFALVCSLFMSGCDREESSIPSEIIGSDVPQTVEVTPFPVEVCGVELPKAVSKVVSLSPAITEIIAELGFTDKLVGICDYCEYPEGLTAKKVGSSENPDLDGIMQLMPDVVFTLSPLSERETYKLGQANITVLNISTPKTVEDYADLYRTISTAFYGKETFGEKDERRTDRVAYDAKKSLEKAVEGVNLGTFIYVTEKLTIAGAETFEGEIISLAGENACKTNGYISSEGFDGDTPSYIVADSELTLKKLQADKTFGSLINNGAKAIFVNSGAFERPSARTAEVFAEIKSALGENTTSE